MKGVTIMTEEITGKKIVQIDLNALVKNSARFEDFFDRLISESRKSEKDISWDTIKNDLKRKKRV